MKPFKVWLEGRTEILRQEKDVTLLRDDRPDGEGNGQLYSSTGKIRNHERGDLVLLTQVEYDPLTKTLTIGSKGRRVGMFDGWKPLKIVSQLTKLTVKVAVENHL